MTSDATLMGLVNAVYQDRADQSAASNLPYVVIHTAASLENDTADTFSQEHSFTLHVWTNRKDSRLGKEIGAEIYRIFHPDKLVVAGSPQLCTIVSRIEGIDAYPDPSEHVMHHIYQLRVIIHELV